MILLKLFAAITVSTFIGFLITCLLWTNQSSSKSALLARLCLSIGLGLGLTSCTQFLLMLLFGRQDAKFIIFELLTLSALAFVLFYARRVRGRPVRPRISDTSIRASNFSRIAAIGFGIALALASISFVVLSMRDPRGSWDALAIWNLRARFIFRSGDEWLNNFAYFGEHTNYPLLLPLSIVRCWMYLGTDAPLVTTLLALLFTFASVGLLVSALAELKDQTRGFIAGIVLLGTVFFILSGASQSADVPLGFFFLASLVLFCLQDKTEGGDFKLACLAGVTAGLAAWTKNEGLLFVLSLIVARCAVVVKMKGFKVYVKETFYFALGLLPILFVVALFKTRLAPPTELIASQTLASLVGNITDYNRYSQIFSALLQQLGGVGGRFKIVALLVLYVLCLGIKIEKEILPAFATISATLFLMLTGYFLIYVLTPYELEWHLRYSLDRVLLQLYPCFVLGCFLLVKPPGKLNFMSKAAPNL